ncbi:MAG TPA: hypothetical protein PKE29_00965 [Phycisphaerales bacterium]|mgnify:CR=1 FL=1|nr:hypothetical protein [Phycisphaerales bacterium]
MKAMGLIVGGIIGCGALAPMAGADEPSMAAQSGSTAAPATNAEQSVAISAWVAGQKPAIETITGAKFRRDVPVKAVSVDEMAQLIAKTIEADMAGAARPDGSPMSAIEIHVRATAAAFKVATRTFGMYRYEDKTVYVVPENVRTYAKRHGWSEQTVERTPRLAVAHELVHALQDQTVALSERSEKLGRERQHTLRVVSEGQAVWATDQLAKQLDWGAANSVLWGVVTGVQAEGEPEKGGAPAAASQRVAPSAEAYTLGRAFVEYHLAWVGEGPKGTQRVWAILRNPPLNLGQIVDPGKCVVKAEGDAQKPGAPGAAGRP